MSELPTVRLLLVTQPTRTEALSVDPESRTTKFPYLSDRLEPPGIAWALPDLVFTLLSSSYIPHGQNHHGPRVGRGTSRKGLGSHRSIRFNWSMVKFPFLWLLLQGKEGGLVSCDVWKFHLQNRTASCDPLCRQLHIRILVVSDSHCASHWFETGTLFSLSRQLQVSSVEAPSG